MKTNTIATIVLAGIVAFSLAACSKSESPKTKAESPTPKISERTEPPKLPQPQQPTPPTLDQEAVALAEKGFLEPWTQVGDSWFTWWHNSNSDSNSGEIWSDFIQIRGVTHEVKPERLSEAETLNGLQWKGSVKFSNRISKEYHQVIKGQQVPQWSDWMDGSPYRSGIDFLPTYHLTKKNGQWTIHWANDRDKEHLNKERLTKPSEEQIKKILPQ